nr:SusC/RagA family TonB-linked outer membrane protein [Longitalea luteola]
MKKFTVLLLPLMAGMYAAAQDQPQQVDSIIVIQKKRPGAISVTGLVTDAVTKKPLRGIRVTYKKYSAAITDSTGAFTIDVPSKYVSVTLHSDDYQTKEIALQGRQQITAALYPNPYNSYFDAAQLPFDQRMKSHTPYATTSLQTNGTWNRVAETPATWLQGKAAGLMVTRRSGTPNKGASLLLRGPSSLYATNAPLIVVDGVLFDNNDYGGSIINNHYTDPLSTIDVKDIDNITVLKDGSSIYGTKGANGVIIITTARAHELQTKIDFASYAGINFTPTNLPVMEAADHRVYLADILKSKGMSDAAIQDLPYMNDDPSNSSYHQYHNNTNWQNLVYDRSTTRNVYLKVTGGDNIAKYGLSLGYMSNGAVIKNTGLTRYNMRFNGDLNLGKRMTATTNLSFTFNEQELRDQGRAYKTNPVFLALIKSPLLHYRELSDKGIESPLLADRDTFNLTNPVSITDVALGSNKSYRFLGSVAFNYELGRSLALSSTVAVTSDKVRENFFIPRKGVTPDTLSNEIAFNRSGSQVKTLFSLYNDTRLTYNQTLHHLHELTARLGIRYLSNKTEQDIGRGFNAAIDELVSVGFGSNALRRVGGSMGRSHWLSTYFNTDYNYAGKYFVSLNVAMDGSSRFGKNIPGALGLGGNKFAVLPSLAAAWLISSENFLKTDLIDLLKLRASIGLSGNDDIGDFTARQYYISQNLLGMQGLTRGGPGNNQLQWEAATLLNAGIDAALLNERISLSVDVYQRKTDKMIVYEPAPVSGFSYAITNTGGMTTKGIEASLAARIVNGAAFSWDVDMNISKYRSTIDKLPVDNIISSFAGASYITEAGRAPNLFYGYESNGVYTTDGDAALAGLSVKKADGSLVPFTGGDIHFTDLNNDNIIDENDRQVIGNPNPDLTGAFNNKFRYKGFELDVLVTFVKGNDIYNYTRNQLESASGTNNQTLAVRNRWRTNGHETAMPKATWGDPMGNSRFSNRWIEDGSYMRLRSVSVTYNIPFKPGFFKYATVYLTGNNLVTLTKYKGYDPEFSATESVFGMGIDNTLEPQFRSILLGARIGL